MDSLLAEKIVKENGKGSYRYVENGKSEIARLAISTSGDILRMAYGKRRFGHYISVKDWTSLEPIKSKMPFEVKWEKGWKKVLKRLEASGLWKDIQQEIKDGLEIGIEKIKAAYNAENNGDWESRDERIRAIDSRLTNSFIRWNMRTEPKVKAMYFSKHKDTNKFYKEQIKKAMASNEKFSLDSRANYDVSFEFHPVDETHKTATASYAEEFRGCGNGHYYIAIDAEHALFMEDD